MEVEKNTGELIIEQTDAMLLVAPLLAALLLVALLLVALARNDAIKQIHFFIFRKKLNKDNPTIAIKHIRPRHKT
jgi:hypothetical protein